MTTRQDMAERLAMHLLMNPDVDEVKTDKADILVRRYACNDFVRLGTIVDVYNEVMYGTTSRGRRTRSNVRRSTRGPRSVERSRH